MRFVKKNQTRRRRLRRQNWGGVLGDGGTEQVSITDNPTGTDVNASTDNAQTRPRSTDTWGKLEEMSKVVKTYQELEEEYKKNNPYASPNEWEKASLELIKENKRKWMNDKYKEKEEAQFHEQIAILRNERGILLLPKRYGDSYYPNKADVETIITNALISFTREFHKKSIVRKINVPENGQLHVIGDIHGDRDALFTYLDNIGPLTEQNHVLFLGDIIDRGDYEWHCLLTVLLYFNRYPKYCTILRGNHEVRSTSAAYGLFTQASKKIDLFKKIETIFTLLPLCCTINNSIFACHGGPAFKRTDKGTKSKTIDDFKQIQLPLDLDEYDKGHPLYDERHPFNQLLWNDPNRNLSLFTPPGPICESKRGCGYEFGKTILDDFLKNSGIKRVLRAHEVKECAITDEFGDGTLLTIFSAPDYCKQCQNTGGYLLMKRETKNASDNTDTKPPDAERKTEATVEEFKYQHIILVDTFGNKCENRMNHLPWFDKTSIKITLKKAKGPSILSQITSTVSGMLPATLNRQRHL